MVKGERVSAFLRSMLAYLLEILISRKKKKITSRKREKKNSKNKREKNPKHIFPYFFFFLNLIFFTILPLFLSLADQKDVSLSYKFFFYILSSLAIPSHLQVLCSSSSSSSSLFSFFYLFIYIFFFIVFLSTCSPASFHEDQRAPTRRQLAVRMGCHGEIERGGEEDDQWEDKNNVPRGSWPYSLIPPSKDAGGIFLIALKTRLFLSLFSPSHFNFFLFFFSFFILLNFFFPHKHTKFMQSTLIKWLSNTC